MFLRYYSMGRFRLLLLLLSINLISGLSLYSQNGSIDDETISNLLTIIENQIAEGRWSEAEENIIGLMKLDPSHPRNMMLFYNLGVCCFNQEKYNEALNYFDIVIAKNPDFTAGLYKRALTNINLNQPEAALKDLSTVLEILPTNTDALFLRSLLNYESGKFQDAATDVNLILNNMKEGETENETLLLAARIEVALKHNDIAANYYDKLIEKDFDIETLIETMFFYIIDYKDYERAQSLIISAFNQIPTDGRLYLAQALICKNMNRNSEMEENIKIAKKYGIDSQTIEFFLNKN